MPPGKAYPDWSFAIQTTCLLIFPGKSSNKDKQAGFHPDTGTKKGGTKQNASSKRTEEGGCLNEVPLNIQNM